MKEYTRKYYLFLFMTLSFFICDTFIFPDKGKSQQTEINWFEGPNTVTLGKNIAQVTFGENYVFANGDDTRKIMEEIGNPPTNAEVGSIFPKNFQEGWFIIFEYAPVGYIKDDEKHSIDSDAILESIKKGTEKLNEKRREMGVSAFHIIGWYEKPHYDETTHNLVWTLLGKSEDSPEGVETVNHNVRLLGRKGYMSVVLVSDRSTLDRYKPKVDEIISNFSYKKGKSYAEYVQGDKVAKYGLTALIAGGAATVAAKTGILKALAKFWKIIIIAIIGFFTAIWKKIKSLFIRN